MDRQTLERLATNPHYKMKPEQIEELRRLRELDAIEHPTSVPRHHTTFKKHPRKLRKEGDERRTN